jgi:cystathionine beta-synthase
MSDPVRDHMGPPLPQVGGGESVDAARRVLEQHDAVLVHVDGRPAGVLTRHDLLAFVAG